MNLLLLLSALLSALGGAGGPRAAQAPVALSSSVTRVAQQTAAVRVSVASRPMQPIIGPTQAAVATPVAWTLAAPIPAYLSRRRE